MSGSATEMATRPVPKILWTIIAVLTGQAKQPSVRLLRALNTENKANLLLQLDVQKIRPFQLQGAY